ncbi:MAG TPA: hypothetical protein VGE12_21705 [Noviherbaspirillum sp.]
MTTITIGSHRSYTRNVLSAAHELIVALLGLDRIPRKASVVPPSERGLTSQAYADVFAAQAGAGPDHSRPDATSALVPYYCWSSGVALGDHAEEEPGRSPMHYRSPGC